MIFDILLLVSLVFSLCMVPTSIMYNADLSTSPCFPFNRPLIDSFPFYGHIYIILRLGGISHINQEFENFEFDIGYCPFCEHH